MTVYTKSSLIKKLKELRNMGWIESGRQGNCGGIGNTVEDFLGIEENNLPIPNAAEWELKCQRRNSNSLVTLFHCEPSPTAFKFVPNILLPKYGWEHKEAGKRYPDTEMSFRQTISTAGRSDRGFKVVVDKKNEKVLISFDASAVDKRHSEWLKNVKKQAGLKELNPQPYWGFKDLYHKAGTKLKNCFFICADTKKINGKEHFRYEQIYKLSNFSLDKFINAIDTGDILVDFDARTGHNHGTKFRCKNNKIINLYGNIEEI
jgi:hypothetical protein